MTTGADPLLADLLGGADAVEDRHLDVHDDDVGPELLGQRDGLLAVAGLADDVVAVLAEHLGEVEADERLVLGHEDAGRRGAAGVVARRRAGAGSRRHGGVRVVGHVASGRADRAVVDQCERDLNPHALASRAF